MSTMKIQAILYGRKEEEDEIKYLLLRRPESRGGYWTFITGHVEKGEQLLDALEREIGEETGIHSIAYVIDLRIPMRFTKEGEEIEEHAFGVQVESREVVLSDEHVEYGWMNFQEAMERLKWEGQKNSLRVLNDMINL